MNHIDNNSVANLFFQVNWNSQGVHHADTYAGHHVNFWRDRMPRRLYDALMSKQSGDRVLMKLSKGELISETNPPDFRTVPHTQFDTSRVGIPSIPPRAGRFYPKGALKDLGGIFRANMNPFRILQANNGKLKVDMGHPASHHPLKLSVTVGSVLSKTDERGGTMRDWGEIIAQGVGMQSRWQNHPTDFFSDHPFQRKDASNDHHFYTRPRLVQHIDDTARDMLKQVYSRFLQDGQDVLDLMASWQSHIPENIQLARLSGLGLNETELGHNPNLTDYHIQDLNHTPQLPYASASFDVVICSLSVEYLVRPATIFKEAARVLRPEGLLVVSFSNRWFPPKAVRIWSELHEFERVGLVLEYFRQSERFHNLHTYSVRGLERPAHDKYYGQFNHADPIFAVWGRVQ